MQSTSPGACALYAATALATLDRGPYGLPLAEPFGPIGAIASDRGTSVQRPFALRPVLLSAQIQRYYGLLCASPRFPPIYVLDDGPFHRSCRVPERVPNLICLSVLIVPPSVPRRTERLTPDCCFIALAGLRHSRTGSASHTGLIGFLPGFLTRLQSSLYAAARRDCSPFTDRAFTFELSPPKSPPRGVEYDYAGKQSIPATGLSPAR